MVCIHGFTGSPYEMRHLGDALARTGATVRGLLLPGHGTSVDDLERTDWQDWASAVEREIDAMFRRCRTVAAVGQSLVAAEVTEFVTRCSAQPAGRPAGSPGGLSCVT